MEESEAIEILIYYNKWRSGAQIPQLSPKTITKAINTIIFIYKNKWNEKKINNQNNNMDLKTYIKKAHENAKNKGFWDKERNKAELLMLINSKLCESLEAIRKDKYANEEITNELYSHIYDSEEINFTDKKWIETYEEYIESTVEAEVADALIRLFDLVGGWNIDIEKHILLKMKYNTTRERLHGKKF